MLGTGESGEGGRGRRPATLGRQRPNLPDEPVAAFVGHRQVTQEDIWVFTLYSSERFVGRGDGGHHRPEVFEHRSDAGADKLAVIHQEHTNAAQITLVWPHTYPSC